MKWGFEAAEVDLLFGSAVSGDMGFASTSVASGFTPNVRVIWGTFATLRNREPGCGKLPIIEGRVAKAT